MQASLEGQQGAVHPEHQLCYWPGVSYQQQGGAEKGQRWLVGLVDHSPFAVLMHWSTSGKSTYLPTTHALLTACIEEFLDMLDKPQAEYPAELQGARFLDTGHVVAARPQPSANLAAEGAEAYARHCDFNCTCTYMPQAVQSSQSLRSSKDLKLEQARQLQ